jgi:hypothetical protein
MCIRVRAQAWEVIDNKDAPCKSDFINAPLQGAIKYYTSPRLAPGVTD